MCPAVKWDKRLNGNMILTVRAALRMRTTQNGLEGYETFGAACFGVFLGFHLPLLAFGPK